MPKRRNDEHVSKVLRDAMILLSFNRVSQGAKLERGSG